MVPHWIVRDSAPKRIHLKWDFEIKKAGSADIFVAFIENVKRDVVVEKADFVAGNFDEVIELIKKHKAKKDI